jgi:sugar diacid utilization regulator
MTPQGVGVRDGGARPDEWWRGQLSNLYGLFVISMSMFEAREVDAILRLAETSAPALSDCEVVATYLVSRGVVTSRPATRSPDASIAAQVRGLTGNTGPVVLPHGAWGWCFALRAQSGVHGCLVVRAAKRPPKEEFFLLEALGQQTGRALAAALLRRREAEQAVRLRDLNTTLSATVARLERQTNVHQVLSEVSASGSGETGLADALHRLTSLSVAVEDRFGNLHAWSGPGRPDPYPKQSARGRSELLRLASAVPHPIRVRDRVISLVKPRDEVLGVLAVVDPTNVAGPQEMFALEYATTVLALELAHQRNLVEVGIRLRRDLVDDLITGLDDDAAYARADAVGHDLRAPHWVVVLRWHGQQAESGVAAAAVRALTARQLSSLASRRSGSVVLLVQGRPDGAALFRLLAEALDGSGALGIGSRCDRLADFSRSYSQACRALEIRLSSRAPHGATTFDTLGVYRILDTGENKEEITAFVREWLGALLDYDHHKSSDLVRTLSQFLECGGSYDQTAAALVIARSTLRYRLGRIQAIAGVDLKDVDSRLNLHVAARAWQVLRGPE